jgi:peptidoglycan/xylan/chitin deacetylase (PgdA/CDA1 family)
VDRVDVLQHGLTHERLRSGTEFGALSRTEASARIATGHATLTRALGRAPSGFVAPWDRLSRGSLEATASVFDFVSTSWVSRDSLPIGALLAHVVERLRQRLVLRLGRTVVSRHLGGLVDARTNPDDVDGRLAAASSRASLTVVMLHHWMFWSSHEPHPVVRALARSLSTRRALRASDVPRMV